MTTLRRTLCGVACGLFVGCTHVPLQQRSGPEQVDPVAVDRGDSPVDPLSPEPELAEPELPPPPHFEGPSPEAWIVEAAKQPRPGAKYTHVAIVTELQVPLYARPDTRTVVGYASVGGRLPAKPLKSECAGGTWSAVSGGAYLCVDDGVRLKPWGYKEKVLDPRTARRVARLDRPTPYKSGKARNGAPVLRRIPTAAELEALDAGRAPAGLVDRIFKGTYLVTIVGTETSGDETFVELLSGEYLRESDVKRFPKFPMHGELLEGDKTLPIAFAYQKANVYCLGGESAHPCGTAEKHARFLRGEEIEAGDQRFLVVDDGLAVRRERVRIAERIPRPAGVKPSDQWIHINLTEQTLVAYEGDRPVYATLVSTGKPGHDTRTGLYQVNRAYATKPMNGVDEDGPYQVQEVPWTMFYHGNYAVHGAYWHDVFGQTRSHGCVNLPPVDARWLFQWAKPQLPRGWSVNLKVKGPRVYITGKTPANEPGSGDA